MTDLSTLLVRGYGAKIQNAEPIAAVLADFATAMEDPDFAAAAQARLAGLVDAICDKCFVSRTYRDFLRQALT